MSDKVDDGSGQIPAGSHLEGYARERLQGEKSGSSQVPAGTDPVDHAQNERLDDLERRLQGTGVAQAGTNPGDDVEIISDFDSDS